MTSYAYYLISLLDQSIFDDLRSLIKFNATVAAPGLNACQALKYFPDGNQVSLRETNQLRSFVEIPAPGAEN